MHFNVEPGVIISTLYYDTEICSIQNNETCNFLILCLLAKYCYSVM